MCLLRSHLTSFWRSTSMDWIDSPLCDFDELFDIGTRNVDEQRADEIINRIIKTPDLENVGLMFDHSFKELLRRMHAKDQRISLMLARARFETMEDEIRYQFGYEGSGRTEEELVEMIREGHATLAEDCREIFTVLSLMNLFYEMMENTDMEIANDFRFLMRCNLLPDAGDFFVGYCLKYQPWAIGYGPDYE